MLNLIMREKTIDRDNNQTGTQGPPGQAGPPGPAGPQGLPGTDGEDGEQGPRGFNGTDGINGTQGIQGPRGFNGTDGINGTQGIQGPRGFNGTDGINGTNGLPGPSGITILNGSNYYVQTGNFSTVANNTAASFASCLLGDVAISGSYDIFFPSDVTGQYDVRTFSSVQNPPTSWATNIVGANGIGVITSVNCFDNPPLR